MTSSAKRRIVRSTSARGSIAPWSNQQMICERLSSSRAACEAVDDLGGVAEDGLIAAEPLVRQIGDRLLDAAQARQVVAVGLGQGGEDGVHVLVVLEHPAAHGVARGGAVGPTCTGNISAIWSALPRVARGAQVLAVDPHALAELGQRGGRRPRVDGQAQVADVREALRRVDADADGRMRLLQRARDHLEVLDLVERAVDS